MPTEPTQLEQDIYKAIQHSVKESVKSVLTGYSSPLTKLITETITRNEAALRKVLEGAMTEVLADPTFANSIRDAFAHKVGRAMIANHDSLFEKVANNLKSDPVYRAKMAVLLSQATDEYINHKQ